MCFTNSHQLMVYIVFLVNESYQINSDLYKLYQNITKNYHKQFFPSANDSSEFRLSIMVTPLVINSVKETEETISVTMVTSLVWTDPHLSWKPSQFGNILNFTITSEDIWLPYVYLQNGMKDLQPLGYDSMFYTVLMYSGTVIWTPGGIMKAKCPMNILIFPFDSQTCRFIFIMWGAAEIRMKFIPLFLHAELNYMINNSDWVITSTRQYLGSKKYLSEFIFELTIEREPWYYFIMIILPTLLFCIMNPFVFLLPVESGERVSLGMTILLSYAIFLTLVSSSLPVSSKPVCLLMFVMILIMMISGFIVVGTILSINIYHKDYVNIICFESKSTGKKASHNLDTVFMILSYVLFLASLLAYSLVVVSYH